MQKEKGPEGIHVVKGLLEAALNNVCQEKGYSREFLNNLEPGSQKRSIVDDITILVLNLEDQVQ